MTRKIFTAAAMCATALAPIISTPAYAAVTVLDSVTPNAADGTTLAAMQSQCDALAAAHDTGNGDKWAGTVVEGDVSLVSGPTEVGTHTFAANGVGEQTGAGTFTPAHRDILGDPYRVGGSVNMFGTQEAVGGSYSASSYDFQNDFTTTFAHAFTCDISVQVYHAAYVIPGHPVQGYYTNNGTNPSVTQGSCQGLSPANPHWGEDIGNCIWQETGPAVDDQDVPESWDDATYVDNEAGTAVNQDQTDSLLAHEDAGEGFSTSETLIIGQVVVCISPGKKGGTWTTQNGYTGSKCTTTWYNGGATVGVPNLNDGSHNWVTVPVV